MALAIMEYTRDALEDAFGVSGGSAIMTDGVYYWRRDTAEYVETYGIDLPAEFLEHGCRLNWVPPSLTKKQVLMCDGYLHRNICKTF